MPEAGWNVLAAAPEAGWNVQTVALAAVQSVSEAGWNVRVAAPEAGGMCGLLDQAQGRALGALWGLLVVTLEPQIRNYFSFRLVVWTVWLRSVSGICVRHHGIRFVVGHQPFGGSGSQI